MIVLDFALAVDGDDVPVGVEVGYFRRAEIENRPARGIMDRPAQRLGQARPGQPDFQHRIRKVQRGQPRRAKRPVLLLRMLQDQQRYPAFDRFDAVANAQRLRLLALRTVRYRLDGGTGFSLGLF